MKGLTVSFFITVLFLSVSVPAKTIHVPGDEPSIQRAIEHAQPGDTVLVAPGTYMENLDFLGKEITVCSEKGAGVTTIDGRKKGSVVVFLKGEGPDAVLEGFTLTNGSGTYVPYTYRGGGIYCDGASPTILRNVIKKNKADWGGGICCFSGAAPLIRENIINQNSSGIGCNGSSPFVEGNTISNNTFTGIEYYYGYVRITGNEISGNGQSGIGGVGNGEISGNVITNNFDLWKGGGIYWLGDDMIIRNNVIAGNTAYHQGGGIYFSGSDAVIENNRIFENQSDRGGAVFGLLSVLRFSGNEVYRNSSNKGAAIHLTNCDTVMYDNLIHHNIAKECGGGLFATVSPILSVNDTFYENEAVESGGGCYGWDDAHLTLVNTVLWKNKAPEGPALTLSDEGTKQHSSAVLSFCDVEGGKASVYTDPGCSLKWGSGMIDADPLFADPAGGDFHLTFTSPCRDAGDDGAVVGSIDFEGDPRIYGSRVDMGADEFHLHLYCTGYAVPGGAVALKIVDTPGTAPVFLWAGSGVLDPPLHLDPYGDWYLALPLVFDASLGAVPGPDGHLVIPFQVPGGVPSPLEIPLQAFSGNRLTNLHVLEIE